ncbi:YveK family protein [Lactobacillus ultunensis]|uniref:Capsular polysaccharide biosynthesis protein CpsC n=1 Tax=Lactobacillus ultunensis DSM 16047 TaxID=525365 RepID=C2EPK4_9LACO|nr:Wzz/FepE/Etk N-terminal domain-containing protein [Lactobacillus ultunensis]EEJ71580.1 chain length determinant protein [Lactobacillus ultunensis DSM 16047]KRL82370.1 exopolysaccharide biosynthesis protein [Lactobacillus ultunensis DSM 16047]
MEQEQKQTDNTIDLTQLLQICRRHIWALILWSIGLAVIGWGLAEFVVTPKYSSSAQILVNQKSRNNDPNAAYVTQQANMQMVTTYKDIVTSHKILEEASNRLANPTVVVKKAKKAVYRIDENGRRRLVRRAQPAVIERSGKSYVVSAKQLAKNISVNTQQQSQVFSISAESNTPAKARAEVNAVAETFSKEIPNIMSVNNVTIVARGTMGTQSSPNVKLYTLAGFVIGLVLSFAVIIIREMTNTTVRDDNYLTQELGLTDLGQVAHFHLSSSFSINKNKPNKRERLTRHRV